MTSETHQNFRFFGVSPCHARYFLFPVQVLQAIQVLCDDWLCLAKVDAFKQK